MQRQVIYPPNSQILSEDVIGNVLQRKWPMRQILNTTHSSWDQDHLAVDQRTGRLSTTKSNITHEVASSILNNISNANQCPRIKMSLQEIAAVTDPTTMDKLQMILQSNRDCRRRIQTRYQNKKKRAFKELKDSIPLLREQVNQLQQKCDALSRKKETLWSASVAYFRIFENGMCGFTTRDLEYLREAIAPDVDTGSAVGLDGLIAHWKRLTQFFPDIHMQLNGLTRVGFDAVVGKIVTTITITEKSLLAAFPHLVDGNIQDDRRKQIAAKLMDQRIEMYGSVRFDWDTTNNRIIGLYTQTDMLSPMLQLVGSLENTVLVFSDALISLDGNLGVGAQQQ